MKLTITHCRFSIADKRNEMLNESFDEKWRIELKKKKKQTRRWYLRQLQHSTVDIDVAILLCICNYPNTIARIDASFHPTILNFSSKSSHNIWNMKIDTFKSVAINGGRMHQIYLINILLGWNATIVKHMSNQMRSVHSECGLFVAWRMHWTKISSRNSSRSIPCPIMYWITCNSRSALSSPRAYLHKSWIREKSISAHSSADQSMLIKLPWICYRRRQYSPDRTYECVMMESNCHDNT